MALEQESSPEAVAAIFVVTTLSTGSIPNPSWSVVLSWGLCSCPLSNPSSTEFRASLVLTNSCYVVLIWNWSEDPSLIQSLSWLKGSNPLDEELNPN